MRCVLCHSTIVNGDVHNLAHRKSLKGLVNYTKDHNTSFMKKHVLKLHSTKCTKQGRRGVGCVDAYDKSCKRS
jgi:hypothetical protein